VFRSSTRGLDSSTALEYVRALRIATDLVKNTTIVSIYQAGESLFEIFDKVCLIYEGKMVYFGPTNQARQYFIDIGYVPANRQTTPDFLVSVTDPIGRRATGQENDTKNEGKAKPIPRTAAEFEDCYRRSETMKRNREDIASYKKDNVDKDEMAQHYKTSAKQDHAQHTRRKVCQKVIFLFRILILLLFCSESLYDFYIYASAHRYASPWSDYEGKFHVTSFVDNVRVSVLFDILCPNPTLSLDPLHCKLSS